MKLRLASIFFFLANNPNPTLHAFTVQCKNRVVPASSISDSKTTTKLSSTSEKAQAGEDGYSLLRQPLTWDSDSDPTFDTPTSLDEANEESKKINQNWFESRIVGKNVEKKFEENPNQLQDVGVGQQQRTMEIDQELDLFQRTIDTLDYPIVLRALKDNCGTAPAKHIVSQSLRKDKPKVNRNKKKSKHRMVLMGLTASSVEEVHERYLSVSEMKLILSGDVEIPRTVDRKAKKIDGPPLNSSFDMQTMWEKTDDIGGVLDGPDVLEVFTILKSCKQVYKWCKSLERSRIWTAPGLDEKEDVSPFVQIPEYGASIFIDDDLLDLLESAFDEDGRLSGTTFQGIGRLRAKVRTLKKDILSTLDTLMSSPSIKNKLSLESGGSLYSEVNGRIVVPISEKYSNAVGIMHDVSRSGKTAYIEPSEIVQPTNEMNQAIAELKQEEAKVWRMLTNTILENKEDIDQSIAVVAQLDLVLARIRLGDKIDGIIPEVRDEGVISLKNAKHPVLLLRELDNVVGSDIDLGSGDNQGLILTGPNSGGKTVILKNLALSALMARDGIPIPAEQKDARVDYFDPILADIGDFQSLDADLSTFSSHMLVCREVLASVSSGKNALVLMDELGSGTDPNQGVAIAQAILEELLSGGARVAITTHYLQLKQLAASDDRFSVGAMQFVRGRPTYKLLPGVVGESFALSVAERLNMPQNVIDRATELMDSDTKEMGDIIRNMEDQKLLVEEQSLELEQKKKELESLTIKLKKEQEKLEREQLNARRTEAAKFAKKLEEKERILEDVLQKLKSDPSKKMIARSWDEIKYVRRDALTEAENVPSVLKRKEKAAAKAAEQFSEMVPISEMREKPEIKEGDTLVICKKGAMSGKEATVINTSGRKINVSVQGMQMSMKIAELALPPKSFAIGKSNKNKPNIPTNGLSKMARKALLEEQADIALGGGPKSPSKNSNGPVMRLSTNTVDCLGCNFEEARRKCENKFAKVMMQKNPVVFILHGHGSTGILKTKLRDWLKREKQFVKKFGAADASDGGDAFTRVELKNSLF